MEAAEARRAVDAAISVAAALGLAVDDAVVLNNSNRIVARLLPCDIVARVSPMGGSAQQVYELILAGDLEGRPYSDGVVRVTREALEHYIERAGAFRPQR